jgi:hypothetical protein
MKEIRRWVPTQRPLAATDRAASDCGKAMEPTGGVEGRRGNGPNILADYLVAAERLNDAGRQGALVAGGAFERLSYRNRTGP